MQAYFNRFNIEMTRAEAERASHPGPCDDDVAALVATPKMRRQLDKIPADCIAAELGETGGWEQEELADAEQNRHRIVWIAAGNITDEIKSKKGLLT